MKRLQDCVTNIGIYCDNCNQRYVNLKRENVHHLNVKRCVLLFEKYEEHM